jgi:hypothetical protein
MKTLSQLLDDLEYSDFQKPKEIKLNVMQDICDSFTEINETVDQVMKEYAYWRKAFECLSDMVEDLIMLDYVNFMATNQPHEQYKIRENAKNDKFFEIMYWMDDHDLLEIDWSE